MRLSMLFGLLTLVATAFILPSVAQDKKDPAKEVKKDDVKKDEAKKDDPPKKDEKDEKPSKKSAKEEKPPEEKVEYSQIVPGKIKAIDSQDITLEIQVPDPKKIYDFKVWAAQQQAQLRQGKPNAQAIANYNKEAAKRQTELTSPKDFPIRAAEGIKVRTAYIPLEYDDKGFPKRFTPKEVAAMKSKTLPGYPADFDTLKVNQFVQVYLAKSAAPAPVSKGSKATKKADDDVELTARPDVVMIVIVGAAASP